MADFAANASDALFAFIFDCSGLSSAQVLLELLFFFIESFENTLELAQDLEQNFPGLLCDELHFGQYFIIEPCYYVVFI